MGCHGSVLFWDQNSHSELKKMEDDRPTKFWKN